MGAASVQRLVGGLLLAASIVAAAPSEAAPERWAPSRYAGGGPRGLPVAEANLNSPTLLAVTPDGGYYLYAGGDVRIYRVDAAGVIDAFLGWDVDDLGGKLSSPKDIAVGAMGEVYVVSDAAPYEILRVDPDTRELTVFSTVETQPFVRPDRIAVAPDGSVWFATRASNGMVARLDPSTGEAVQVVGDACWSNPGACSYADGPVATLWLAQPAALAFDGAGNLYVAEESGHRVRKIDTAGVASTVGGNGTAGFAGDGGPGPQAQLDKPVDLAVDPAGNAFVADNRNNRIRRIDALTGIIDTWVGTGVDGFDGDGGLATEALIGRPVSVAVDLAGDLLLSAGNWRVRKVTSSSGLIDTIGGNGTQTYSGDGYAATQAALSAAASTVDLGGNLLIADTANYRLRRVDAETGIIVTIAGTGAPDEGAEDDGLPALEVPLSPLFVAAEANGDLLVLTKDVTGQRYRLRRIEATGGTIATLADDLRGPLRVAPDGTILAFVLGPRRLVRIAPASGDWSVVAGGGALLPANGLAATEVELTTVQDFVIAPDGTILLSAPQAGGVFEVVPESGRLRVVAGGSGAAQEVAGGLPAIGTGLSNTSLAFDPWGQLYLVHRGSAVRRLDARRGTLHVEFGALSTTDPPPLPGMCCGTFDPGGDLYLTAWRNNSGAIWRLADGNRPPVADAGSPLDVACNAEGGARVTLDGSGSFDPDSSPDVHDDLATMAWTLDPGTAGERVVARRLVAEAELPVGHHTVRLEVVDRAGRSAVDTATVTVRDDDDPDGDGVGACLDNCLAAANADQIDADANGLGDACDPCRSAGQPDVDGDTACDDDDNCPTFANAPQDDTDGDGVGDGCDVCPNVVNPDQSAHGTCLQTTMTTPTCLAVSADTAGSGERGRLLLSRATYQVPAVIFRVRHSACTSGDIWSFFLNDTLVAERVAPATSQCGTCSRGFTWVGAIASEIDAAWNPKGPNAFRFVKTGDRDHVFWVDVLYGVGAEDIACIPGEQPCVDQGPCDPATPGAEIDAAVTVDDTFFTSIELRAETFADGPAGVLDIEELPEGEYRLCVARTVSDDPGHFLVGGELGQLWRTDAFTAETTFQSLAPLALLELEVAADGVTVYGSTAYPEVVRAFDAATGVVLSDVVATSARLGAIAWIGTGYRAADQQPGSDAPPPSNLYAFDPTTGALDALAGYGETLTDLAWHARSGTLFALLGDYRNGVRRIVRVDPDTWRIMWVHDEGTGGFRTLALGPDGLLYAVRDGDRSLYRIDPGSGDRRPVGPMAIDDMVLGLSLVGSPGTFDCTDIVKDGQALLLVNRSCTTPVPVANVPAAVECAGPAGTPVMLDASASLDPAAPGGDPAGLTFEWYEDYGAHGQALLATGVVAEVLLARGTHAITLMAFTAGGESAAAEEAVAVVDSMPPVLTAGVSPAVLWPPDGELVDIAVALDATDTCAGAIVPVLIDVTANEPDDAAGDEDGSTTDDVQGANLGESDPAFSLRAERSVAGPGRAYVASYAAADGADNSSIESVEVTVPLFPPLDPRIVLDRTPEGTLVTWEALPGALGYDVVRGNLAALNATVSTVGLGNVVCVEADSLDLDTAGFEDARNPRPGTAVFYLVQYSDGTDRGYGTGSDGRLRRSASGDCP